MGEPSISARAWDPSIERGMLDMWEREGLHRFDPSAPGAVFTIDTPPPYPSGRPWHIGAAAHYSQIDMIARTARMRGRNVYFPIGIDRNGLPVELYTEKRHGIRMRETDRAEFLRLCAESLDDLEAEMAETMRSLGLSGDVAGRYRTDSDEYRSLTQSTFIDLWKRGLVYLATRPNNYDWASGTTIADAEIAYEELPTDLVHMRFAVEGGEPGQELVIASTRPELLCACRAVVVGPGDARHAGLAGRRAVVPLYGNAVPISEHPSVDASFGSGAVMVCSYGDRNDVALFRELGLDEVASVGLDGRMTDAAGPYAGLRPRQARRKIIEDLKGAGLVERIERITHRTPVSERSKNPIEIVPMEEYYLRQTDAVGRLRSISAGVRFHPEAHRQILSNWLDSVSMDWPISRRRYYGTEIPVWRCRACGAAYLPEPGRYVRPWRDACPAEKCAECGAAAGFDGERRTFDTWMDSSVSPLFVCRYGRDEGFFGRTYPAAVRPQAKDIVRTWLYYTLLRCDQLTGRAPWSAAWVMGYGLDEHGGKMSKSKGNAIDPLPVIRELGADVFRFWSAGEVTHGHDFRCNMQKISAGKKFLSKLWNVSRFISGFAVPAGLDAGARRPAAAAPPPGMPASDAWVLGELDALVRECSGGYDEYNFFVPAVAVREFTWNLFAAHYIEMVKARAYGDGFSDAERDSAVLTLHTVLSTLLRLIAPITPFIAERLWQELYSGPGGGKSIHRERLPEPAADAAAAAAAAAADDVSASADPRAAETRRLVQFNSRVWAEKKARGLSLRDGLDMEVPDSLAAFSKDLAAMHGLAAQRPPAGGPRDAGR